MTDEEHDARPDAPALRPMPPDHAWLQALSIKFQALGKHPTPEETVLCLAMALGKTGVAVPGVGTGGWQPIGTAPRDGTWIIGEADQERGWHINAVFRCRWIDAGEPELSGWFNHKGVGVEPDRWALTARVPATTQPEPDPRDDPDSGLGAPTQDEPGAGEDEAELLAEGLWIANGHEARSGCAWKDTGQLVMAKHCRDVAKEAYRLVLARRGVMWAATYGGEVFPLYTHPPATPAPASEAPVGNVTPEMHADAKAAWLKASQKHRPRDEVLMRALEAAFAARPRDDRGAVEAAVAENDDCPLCDGQDLECPVCAASDARSRATPADRVEKEG